MKNLADIQEELGLLFEDPYWLETAFTHSSFVNESPDPNRISNERLEFLGDAVLGLVIAETLFTDNPEMTEGQMTQQRSRLVRRDTLASVSLKLNLNDYLELGKGEEANGGRMKPTTLEATFEALIAAVYLDKGLEAARDFILKALDRELEEVSEPGRNEDFKSTLQEILQAKQQPAPSYSIRSIYGPAHNRTFIADVAVGETIMGSGTGSSKKAAEKAAAGEALKKLSDYFTD